MNLVHERKYSTANIYSIYVNSQSSIIATSNSYIRNTVVRSTVLKFQNNQETEFKFARVKGLAGVTENELAD